MRRPLGVLVPILSVITDGLAFCVDAAHASLPTSSSGDALPGVGLLVHDALLVQCVTNVRMLDVISDTSCRLANT